MPSNQLSFICEQIEKQDTDHFGKFYMYVTLLNTVAVRNKTFVDSLPKYSSGLTFWRDYRLNVGEISDEFSQQLDDYASIFVNSQPHWSSSLYNIALAYVRKGKISDLSYIIDQILYHLVAVQGQQSHNNDIYNSIGFEERKVGLIAFIEQISTLNQQLLSTVDSVGNTALSLLAVTTGAVLIVASIFALIPTLIGLGFVIGGACSAYYFVTQVNKQVEQLAQQMDEVMQTSNQLPIDMSFILSNNHRSFYGAAIKPLPYATLTGVEQLMVDESQEEKLKEKRNDLDSMSAIFSC